MILYMAARADLGLSSLSFVIVFAAVVNTLIRVAFLKKYRNDIISSWVSLTVAPSLVFCIPVIIWLEMCSIAFDGWWKLIIGGFGALIVALPSAYFLGLEKLERPDLGSILKLAPIDALGSLEAKMLKFTRRFISSLGRPAHADFQPGRDPETLRRRLAFRDLVSSPIETLQRAVRPISDADLLKRWAEPANLLDDWDERTHAMAAMIPNGAAVLEFGAGRMILRDLLGPDCTYQASDLVARDASTIVCDLNQALPKLRFKYSHAVFSGVLEYIRDIRRVIGFLSQEVDYVVASYTPLENLRSLAIRYNNGWVNHLTLEEFVQSFRGGGFVLENSMGWRDQVILVFRNDGQSRRDMDASSSAEVGS